MKVFFNIVAAILAIWGVINFGSAALSDLKTYRGWSCDVGCMLKEQVIMMSYIKALVMIAVAKMLWTTITSEEVVVDKTVEPTL